MDDIENKYVIILTRAIYTKGKWYFESLWSNQNALYEGFFYFYFLICYVYTNWKKIKKNKKLKRRMVGSSNSCYVQCPNKNKQFIGICTGFQGFNHSLFMWKRNKNCSLFFIIIIIKKIVCYFVALHSLSKQKKKKKNVLNFVL